MPLKSTLGKTEDLPVTIVGRFNNTIILRGRRYWGDWWPSGFGRVVKPLGSKQEVPGSNPGAAESVGQ